MPIVILMSDQQLPPHPPPGSTPPPPTGPPSSPPGPTPPPIPNGAAPTPKKGMSTGKIIGITIGSTVLGFFLLGGCVALMGAADTSSNDVPIPIESSPEEVRTDPTPEKAPSEEPPKSEKPPKSKEPSTEVIIAVETLGLLFPDESVYCDAYEAEPDGNAQDLVSMFDGGLTLNESYEASDLFCKN